MVIRYLLDLLKLQHIASIKEEQAMKLCGFEVGLDQPFFLIAGPCVIESEQFALETAGKLKELTNVKYSFYL